MKKEYILHQYILCVANYFPVSVCVLAVRAGLKNHTTEYLTGFLLIWSSSEWLCAVNRPITSPKACPDLWSSGPNLMGHQSSNPHQPAQWISTTRIWSRPCPSQRALTPTKCKSEVAPLGQRPAGVYPHPQVMWPDWPDPMPPGNWSSGSGESKTGRPKKKKKKQHVQTHSDLVVVYWGQKKHFLVNCHFILSLLLQQLLWIPGYCSKKKKGT